MGRTPRDLPARVTPAQVQAEADRLKGRSWATLSRLALEAGIPLKRVKEARTREELRLAIALART